MARISLVFLRLELPEISALISGENGCRTVFGFCQASYVWPAFGVAISAYHVANEASAFQASVRFAWHIAAENLLIQ